MTAKTNELRHVGPEFLTDATAHPRATRAMPCRPEVLFTILVDAENWTRWTGATDAHYSTEPPHGVGSRRIVTIRNQVLEEEFIVWEPGRRLTFTVWASSLPVRAMVEDFTISPVNEANCLLTWTTAIEGRPRALSRSLGLVAYSEENRSLDRLRRFVARHADEYA